MISRLKQIISQNRLFHHDDRLLLAVSGGVDSMVLMHLFHKLPYKFLVAHVNYNLRGEDSGKDAQLVESSCQDLGIEFLYKNVDTRDISEKSNKSIQMVARDVRYEWFEELMKVHELDYILTAHHADDNLETALFNLTKGTGISGLRGIPIRNEKRVRPLISFSKESIYEYAKEKGIVWREDKTNDDPKYTRNRIRSEVIPELRKINPSISEHFFFTQMRLIGAEKLLINRVEKIKNEALKRFESHWELSTSWIKDSETDLVVLSEILQDFSIFFQESVQIFDNIGGQSGKRFSNAEYEVVYDRNRLIIHPSKAETGMEVEILADTDEVSFDGQELHIERLDLFDLRSVQTDAIAAMDQSKIRYPLKVRKWKSGDQFMPLGMKNLKKVSDFLIDEKVPLPDKKRQYVLESDGKICWVIGRRVSEEFKISDSTDSFLVIRHSLS